MAARFPQSASSLTWRIKPAYAGKILAIYWPASADSVHCLRTGDTATTLITRSASGAGFNADGRITGTVGGAGGVYFSHGVSGGLGVDENDHYVLGCSYYGDIFNGVSGGTWLIGADTFPDSFTNAGSIKVYSSIYTFDISPAGGGGTNNAAGGNDDVRAFISMAMRHDPADGTAKFRFIANGAEVIGARSNPTVSSTNLIGSPGRPLKFGGTYTGTGNTSLDGEAWYVGANLSVAEVEAITADPSTIIEFVAADTTAPVLTSPTGTATGASTASGTVVTDEANGTLYRLASTNATESAATVIAAALTQTVTATGSQSVSFTGLTPSTAYYAHYVHRDAAGNNSGRVSSSSFTTTAGTSGAVIKKFLMMGN
jgi:hypothetical protein